MGWGGHLLGKRSEIIFFSFFFIHIYLTFFEIF